MPFDMLLRILTNQEDNVDDYMTIVLWMKNLISKNMKRMARHNLKEKKERSEGHVGPMLHAHEMENVKDLEVKVFKKNFKMIQHWMTWCTILKNMNDEFTQNTFEHYKIYTFTTWSSKGTTWEFRFTLWLRPSI